MENRCILPDMAQTQRTFLWRVTVAQLCKVRYYYSISVHVCLSVSQSVLPSVCPSHADIRA